MYINVDWDADVKDLFFLLFFVYLYLFTNVKIEKKVIRLLGVPLFTHLEKRVHFNLSSEVVLCVFKQGEDIFYSCMQRNLSYPKVFNLGSQGGQHLSDLRL